MKTETEQKTETEKNDDRIIRAAGIDPDEAGQKMAMAGKSPCFLCGVDPGGGAYLLHMPDQINGIHRFVILPICRGCAPKGITYGTNSFPDHIKQSVMIKYEKYSDDRIILMDLADKIFISRMVGAA